MSSLTRVFNKKELVTIAIFVVVVVASPIILFIQNDNSHQETLENQGYIRYIACVVDVRNKAEALTIPVEKLDQCWSIAEEQVGTKLPRYYNLVN